MSGVSNSFAFAPTYHLNFENDSYRSTVTPSEFPILSAGLEFNSSNDEAMNDTENEYRGDFEGRMSPTHPHAYTFSSRNLYWGEKDQSYESPLRFTFGRRLINWSKVDELWQVGEFEPIAAWDRLRPVEQGLTGIFAYTETQKLNFRIFLSYLAIPETNPNVVIQNHQFQSENPQSISSAPQTINLLGRPTPVGYTLDIPSIGSIIFRPSFAFMVETKKEIPLTAKFVYGYLPLNYFPVAIVGTLNLNTNSAPVELSPRLLYHHLYNGELSYRVQDSLSLGTVLLIDQPVTDNVPSNLTTTPLTSSYTFSPWIEYELPFSKIILTQIWTAGGLDADVGDQKNTNGTSLFSSRLLYRNASQISLKAEFGDRNPHHPTLQAKYIHEYSIIADWIALDFSYALNPDLTVFAGGDLIGAIRDVSPDRGAEFLSDLRSNDRIRLGVNYVF